jgi:cobalt-zinc-cadmium resistance protein CzcA
MESLSGIKGDNSVKIFGPELDKLETLATKAKNILQDVKGIENVGIFHIRGQSHLEFRPDPEKCNRWGVAIADVNNVVSSALGARAMTSMVEGEKLFDIAIRWPKALRSSETSILDIPVDITNNAVVQSQGPERDPLGIRRWPGGALQQGVAGRHFQPDLWHTAVAVARPGVAGGRGRRHRPQRAVRAPRGLDHLPRTGQAHDRYQI